MAGCEREREKERERGGEERKREIEGFRKNKF
jgi:hypothetical protein